MSPTAASATDAGYLSLRKAGEHWLTDGRARGWSVRTVGNRRHQMEKLAWWLENEAGIPPTLFALTPLRVREFLTYVREARREGRWGSGQPVAKRQARPSSVHTMFRAIRAFSNFCLAEGLLDENPMRNVRPPKVPNDQIVPLDRQQVQQLLDAARRTRDPERNVALVMVLIDAGMRAAELCALRIADLDRGSGELALLGKGGKKRRVYLGAAARRAVWKYLEAERRDAGTDEPLFVSIGGHEAGSGLTPSGLGQIVRGLGQAAGITGVRVSPHTLRHSFALAYLRNGGSVLELQKLLGHESLEMTKRYVNLAESDLAQAHRNASPGDCWNLK